MQGEAFPAVEANLALIRRGYDAFVAGDLDAIFAILDPDAELNNQEAFPEGGIYRGHTGFVEMVGGLMEMWQEWTIVADEFHPVGENQVLVLHRQCGVGRVSGVQLESRLAHLWEIRQGRATRLVTYGSWEDGRRAAGLD